MNEAHDFPGRVIVIVRYGARVRFAAFRVELDTYGGRAAPRQPTSGDGDRKAPSHRSPTTTSQGPKGSIPWALETHCRPVRAVPISGLCWSPSRIQQSSQQRAVGNRLVVPPGLARQGNVHSCREDSPIRSQNDGANGDAGEATSTRLRREIN